MENKGLLLLSSPVSALLLSSRPRSLLSTAVYMAGLFSLTSCESHETGGHQGPGPPRQHAPPQYAPPPPSLSLCFFLFIHTNNHPHYAKHFIPQSLFLLSLFFPLPIFSYLCHFLSLYTVIPTSSFYPLISALQWPSHTVTSACLCCLAVMSHVFASAARGF